MVLVCQEFEGEIDESSEKDKNSELYSGEAKEKNEFNSNNSTPNRHRIEVAIVTTPGFTLTVCLDIYRFNM